MNLKFSDFFLFTLILRLCRDRGSVSFHCFLWRIERNFLYFANGGLMWRTQQWTSICHLLSAAEHCRIFIKFRIKFRYKILLNQTNFHENRLSDSRLTGWMAFHFCQQSINGVTLPNTTTVYFIMLYVSYIFRYLWQIIRLLYTDF
jgi:hypothetical protein